MAEKINVKRIKMDVVDRLNGSFKAFSKLLQDSTMEYALFRGCISPVDEDQFLLELLASDEKGNWRKLDLQCDFGKDDIIYETENEYINLFEDHINTLSNDDKQKERLLNYFSIIYRNS